MRSGKELFSGLDQLQATALSAGTMLPLGTNVEVKIRVAEPKGLFPWQW